MVRFTRPHLMQSLPTIGGVGTAALVAAVLIALPDWRLEAAVNASGLPSLLGVAQPPLGLTARALLALTGATLGGAVVWSALYLLWGPGGFLEPRVQTDGPTTRRADAHPDAPPRWPLHATDLGVPPPPAVRPIPADLDQPLAAYHPAAIPEVPLEPVRAIRPPERPAERIETFTLPTTDPAPKPSTIEGLIERLEQGIGRRAEVAVR